MAFKMAGTLPYHGNALLYLTARKFTARLQLAAAVAAVEVQQYRTSRKKRECRAQAGFLFCGIGYILHRLRAAVYRLPNFLLSWKSQAIFLSLPCVCVLHIEPLFPPTGIQHTQEVSLLIFHPIEMQAVLCGMYQPPTERSDIE